MLRQIKKSASTITKPRTQTNGIQDSQLLGSKSNRSNGVRASNVENSDTEDEDDHFLRESEMYELRNPARPFHQKIPNLDETIVSNEDSEEDDYHMVTAANRQLHRQISQNPQSLIETVGSHADQKRPH